MGSAMGKQKFAVLRNSSLSFVTFTGNLPDLHISIQDIMAEEDKVIVRVLLEGTHLDADSCRGNRRVSYLEGQFVEGWNSRDQLGLLRQIGALPAPGGEDQFLTARS